MKDTALQTKSERKKLSAYHWKMLHRNTVDTHSKRDLWNSVIMMGHYEQKQYLTLFNPFSINFGITIETNGKLKGG